MSLKKYIQKRAFTQTPEPRGKKIKSQKNLCFVIQKHHASHLHYDFRLEMDGVLKSWAVPKGPSLNPLDKRLAIMVEDHPYEYKDFEGTIPKGNYGAGTVIIWDEGTYELLKTSDLKKGNLKIFLQGHKLKGEFVLVKIKKTQDNWLLIKKNDRYAKKTDILKKDKSVRSQSSNKVKLIIKNLPKKVMPKFIKPMLAYLVDQSFSRRGWIFEIKWDGYRMLAYINNQKVKLLSRNQIDFTRAFSPVTEELSTLNINAVIDGEIVVVDTHGHSKFQLLQQYQQNHQGTLLYYAFDLIWLEGHDLRELPLIKRKKLLNMILPPGNYIRISDHIEENGEDFFKVAEEENLEGIMAKDGSSVYLDSQRSRSWLKIKTHQRQEVVIGGFTAPKGSRTHLGALIIGVYEGKNLQYVGHVGVADEKNRSTLKQLLNKLITKNSSFQTTPKLNAPATWVKPKLICEVRFSEWTDEGHLRQPIFIGIRKDSTIKLTHLDKIFWPKEGYTKGDLIAYYQSVADIILPHLKDRPLSLHRHPQGINEKGFFQKNYPNAPEWITKKIVHSKHEERDIHYLVCQNQETLLYLANLGCIEMNPWLSKIKTLKKPDFCVLDLDPESIDFNAVIKTAQYIHRLLEKIGIESFCKTSGATGLHIYIPLGAKYSYKQSGQFAELIAIMINRQLPDITSVIRSPAKRQGKVYIDFLQNRMGQTMASPYSVRPQPGALISTPLLWSEVNSRLHPTLFHIKNIHKRIEKKGDLWQKILTARGIDLLSIIKKLQE